MLAGAAARIVMHHDAVADPHRALAGRAPECGDDATRLVAGDHRAAHFAEPQRRGAARGAIEFQVAAAHAGRFYLDDDVARARRRIGEFHQLQFAFAEEGHAAHGWSPGCRNRPFCLYDTILEKQLGEGVVKVVSYRPQGRHGVGVVTGANGLIALAKAAPELPVDLRKILEIDPTLAKVREAAAGKSADLSLDDIAFDP